MRACAQAPDESSQGRFAEAWDTRGVISRVNLERYLREVSPRTLPLWGAGRDLATYRSDLERLAKTSYLRRQDRFTVGLVDGDELACTCKLYEREIRWERDGHTYALSALGIGAVFTPEHLRGRGYASVMLGELLDEERARGRDLVYLFSDIHPAFYTRLGFSAMPSRLITLRASLLEDRVVAHAPVGARDWSAVRACFEASDARTPWSFARTPVVWDWIRSVWDDEERRAQKGSQMVRTLVRGKRGPLAYAIGRRVPRQDAFVLDDFGWSGEEGRATLGPLLRAAAGDLTRISGWLPPAGAREALARGTVRARKSAILMAVPLSRLARSWRDATGSFLLAAKHDPVWPADHV